MLEIVMLLIAKQVYQPKIHIYFILCLQFSSQVGGWTQLFCCECTAQQAKLKSATVSYFSGLAMKLKY